MKNKAVLLMLLILSASLLANLLHCEEIDEVKKIDFDFPKNPTLAGTMSVFIPGTGQFYNEKYLKGSVFIVAQASLVKAVVHYNKRTKEFRKKVHELDEVNFSLQKRYEDYYEKRQSYIFWLGASVFLSGIDAFVDAHLFNYNIKKNEIKVKFEEDKIQLSVSF